MTPAIRRALGPRNLGFLAGFAAASGFLGCSGRLVGSACDSLFILRFAAGSIMGCLGGGAGGLMAREKYLHVEWRGRRPLVGLSAGALMGGLLGVQSFDGWIVAAGVIGGGIGGLTEALVHRNAVDEA